MLDGNQWRFTGCILAANQGAEMGDHHGNNHEKKDGIPLLMNWSYIFLALTHQHVCFFFIHFDSNQFIMQAKRAKSTLDKQSLDGGHQYGEVIARLL